MKSLRLLIICGAMWLSATGSMAQTIGVSCPEFFKDVHQRIACVEAVLLQNNYHFTLASLPPSNGFGPGLVLLKTIKGTTGTPARSYELDMSVTGAVTTNSSWFSGGDLTWTLPFRNGISEQPSGLMSSTEKNWHNTLLHVATAHQSVRTLYFYGNGSRSPDTRYVYSEDDTYGEVDGRLPLMQWLVATGESEVRASTLPGIADPAAVALHFMPAALPGLTTQPIYLHNDVGVETRVSPRISHKLEPLPSGDPKFQSLMLFQLENNARFDWQQPADGSSFAFRQFRFEGDERMNLHGVLRNSFPVGQHRLLYHLCEDSNKQTDECDFGQFDVKSRLILTDTSGTNQVPFYKQPTLGGSDIDNAGTLRGYDNYRFRGLDAALLQFEYGVPVWDPFGVYVFYDAGTVGNTAADLALTHFRQDAGFGLSVRLAGNIVAQTYYAFGAGHGGRWNYNFAKTF